MLIECCRCSTATASADIVAGWLLLLLLLLRLLLLLQSKEHRQHQHDGGGGICGDYSERREWIVSIVATCAYLRAGTHLAGQQKERQLEA